MVSRQPNAIVVGRLVIIALIILIIFAFLPYNLTLILIGLSVIAVSLTIIIYNKTINVKRKPEPSILQDLTELEGISEADLEQLRTMDIYKPADLLKAAPDLDIIAEFTNIPENKLRDWVEQTQNPTPATPQQICPYCHKKITGVGDYCPQCGSQIK